VTQDCDQREDVAKRQKQENQRQCKAQNQGNRAQFGGVFAANHMDEFAHQIVGACMRWLKRFEGPQR